MPSSWGAPRDDNSTQLHLVMRSWPPRALFHLVLQAAGSIYSSLRCAAQAQTEIITHGNPLVSVL